MNWLEPSSSRFETPSQIGGSIAISLKRIADALDSLISGTPDTIKELNVRANCDIREGK